MNILFAHRYLRTLRSVKFVMLALILMVATLNVGTNHAAGLTPIPKVVGNKIVDQNTGNAMRLLGVNRSGLEFACIQGWGLFDGPSDTASVNAIKSWGVNTVRVTLNEDCWLAINGASSTYSGAVYRTAVQDYVTKLNTAGIVAVLDMHWNGAGTTQATGQQLMADADHAPAFWSSVATTFKNNPSVVFDLYNEPNGITWSCWRDGCMTSQGWQSAGMQSLVDSVRTAGATQPIILGGLEWANDLTGWMQYKPVDPLQSLVAGFHLYSFNACSNITCWNNQIAPVAANVPVFTGELGARDCNDTVFANTYFDWADSKGISYLGWTWNVWDCTIGPVMISSYDGTPTIFGLAYKNRFQALAGVPLPDTTPPSVSLNSPLNAATVSGITNINTTATDNVGVAKIEFYADGGLISSGTNQSYAWDTATVANGSHFLQAKAYDAAGNTSSSAVINVMVGNTISPPPTVLDLVAPTTPTNFRASLANAGRNIRLTWTASTDNVAVTGYNIYRGGLKIGSTTGAFYTDSQVNRGASYAYTVAAYDAAGNISQYTVPITVKPTK